MHGGIQIYVYYIRHRPTQNPDIYSDIQLLVAKIKKAKQLFLPAYVAQGTLISTT
jgi:hypothetical protein